MAKRWRIAPDGLRWAIHSTRIRVDPWLCNLTGWTVCIYPPACRSRRFQRALMERTRKVRECAHVNQRLNTYPDLAPEIAGRAFVCEDCGCGVIRGGLR